MASTVIYRDSVSTGHNKFTFSAWVKRSAIATSKTILGMYNNNDQRGKIRFGYSAENKLYVWLKNGVGTEFNWYSNREFRDCNGWYHIVVTIDTTQATASNRCKVYVNGEELTGNTSGQDIVQNSTTMIFGHSKHSIGNSYYNGSWESQYFDGLMSHVHCCYGYAYQASDFGQYDANGVWTIKTSPNVSYGTNGHFILKDGNSVTDQSGNNISLTTNGTLTNTEDSPSNVFCTLNPLDRAINGTAPTFANGNTKWTSSGNGTSNNGVKGTLGFSKGKYYWEAKFNTASQTAIGMFLINGTAGWDSNGYIAANTGFYGIQNTGTKRVAGVSTASVFTALSDNDIGMFACDLDNNKFWFGVNGTWVASGNPASGTNSLGTLSSGTYLPIISNVSWSTASSASFNFGNGYFGTTAVASAGTNASGNGIFEYDVPTGYTALCTKGLNGE